MMRRRMLNFFTKPFDCFGDLVFVFVFVFDEEECVHLFTNQYHSIDCFGDLVNIWVSFDRIDVSMKNLWDSFDKYIWTPLTNIFDGKWYSFRGLAPPSITVLGIPVLQYYSPAAATGRQKAQTLTKLFISGGWMSAFKCNRAAESANMFLTKFILCSAFNASEENPSMLNYQSLYYSFLSQAGLAD